MSRKGRVVFLILLTLGGILPLSIFLAVPTAHGMVRFGSFSELQRFLLERARCGYGYTSQFAGSPALYGRSGALTPQPLAGSYNGQAAQSDSSANTAPSHSETNNQVAGVDELDSLKTDGQYIYTVTNNTVVIVDAYPVSDARMVSRISVPNQTIDGIFVEKDRLSIVSEAFRFTGYGYGLCGFKTGVRLLKLGAAYYGAPQVQNTSIRVYDLTSRSSPKLQTSVTVNGTFIGGRLIGDIAYIVSSSPARLNQSLTEIVVNGRVTQTQATEIYHSDVSDAAFSYTTILSVNMTQDNPTPKAETYLLGTSSTIYVSLTNIFLTQPVWDGRGDTAIHRISIDNSKIKYEATGAVPGHVLNQFSMDEYQGHFRVVTTVYPGWTGPGSGLTTSVYVLNSNLEIVGRLEGLGRGENFHSARFMGDMGYLVTFKKTDPLFVIELGDPTKPSLLGELNVTGYSDYLQAFDQSHLIGIGKDTVDEGSFAWYQGVKVSLFDVSDPSKPSEVGKYVIGDRGSSSPALTDHRAVLLDAGKNLLVIPVTVSISPNPSVPNSYGTPVWQGAYVFQVTTNTLTFRGGITHIPAGLVLNNLVGALTITRTLYIGNVLYTISNAMVKMSSLTDLSDLGSISLI